MTKKIEIMLSIICCLLAGYIFFATLFIINAYDLAFYGKWSSQFTAVLLTISLSIFVWLSHSLIKKQISVKG